MSITIPIEGIYIGSGTIAGLFLFAFAWHKIAKFAKTKKEQILQLLKTAQRDRDEEDAKKKFTHPPEWMAIFQTFNNSSKLAFHFGMIEYLHTYGLLPKTCITPEVIQCFLANLGSTDVAKATSIDPATFPQRMQRMVEILSKYTAESKARTQDIQIEQSREMLKEADAKIFRSMINSAFEHDISNIKPGDTMESPNGVIYEVIKIEGIHVYFDLIDPEKYPEMDSPMRRMWPIDEIRSMVMNYGWKIHKTKTNTIQHGNIIFENGRNHGWKIYHKANV